MSQTALRRPWYIAIEGAIGVGKTTLARLLGEHFRTNILLEVFEENPFLAKFYESRARYAFQTQMFFLLSRYRQQRQISRLRSHGPLISDYMFDKDWLFAQLNLVGDEWAVYRQIHAALAEQIPNPDLIVYLQADTDVLMGRIAMRDRAYERAMERDYIEALRQAYEQFFSAEGAIPTLYLDTNHLNFVMNPADLHTIVMRVQSALREGEYQQQRPAVDAETEEDAILVPGRSLADYQRFHDELDQSKGFNTDMFFNYLRLGEEIGELSSELAQLWIEEYAMVAQGIAPAQARDVALRQRQPNLESELADCMAYILKLANYANIDLEKAYLGKMKTNQDRNWEQLDPRTT